MATTLFPTKPKGAENAIVYFRCGIMNTTPIESGKKFKVKADPRKGMLTLERGSDGMLHIYWKVRPSATVCEDFSVLPGAQSFEKVETGKEGDRVYLLQFKGQEKRRFFWMQEPNAEKDADNLKQLTDAMALPPTDGAENSRSGSGTDRSSDEAALMQSILASMGGQRNAPAPSSSSGPDANTAASSSASISTDVFEAALMTASNAIRDRVPDVPLNAILRGSTLEEFVRKGDDEGQADLIQHLPDGLQTREELRDSISSPQFSQALRRLSAALSSDNYNSIMANFGLDPSTGSEAMMRGNNIEAFLQAIQAQHGASEPPTKDKDSEE